jgi:hypothetical protein
MRHIFIAAMAAFTLCTPPASANDSEASVAIGGLELVQSASISMDSEDLFLSAKEVRVTYRFTNTAKKDIETLIAFPLPTINSHAYYTEGDSDPYIDPNSLNFKTWVDGKPVQLTTEYVAQVKGKTVNNALKKYGLPIDWTKDPEFREKLNALSAEQVKAALNEGLLVRDSDGVMGNWTVTANITRKQRFPGGATIRVEHRYTPSLGGSVGGALLQTEPDIVQHYKDNYCTDKSFLAGFQAKMAEFAKFYKARGEESSGPHSETWLDYVLKSGANWKGPIKDFRLVVDKGNARNLVSFCMDGVKKISPTQFEVRRKNFEPKKDLAILIVNIPDQKDLMP